MAMRNAREQGFTLIEMLVTMAILAILTMIALPSFRNAIHRNQVTAAGNQLVADINYARAEAVSRGIDVSVCPSSDGASCSTATAYDAGWLVYTYTPGNAVANTAYSSSGSTNLILRYTQAQANVSIQATVTPTNSVVTFGSQGGQLPKNSAAALQFDVCYKDTSGTASSTGQVQGMQVNVGSAGGINSVPLAAGAACS